MQAEDQRPHQDRYAVVPRTLIFVTREPSNPNHTGDEEEILLLKGAADKRLWANKYNGIGGHLEPGESPEASARRELREETGLEVESLQLSALVHITMPEPPGIMLFVFLGTGPRGDLQASEEGAPVWIARQQLDKLALVEDLPELIPRLLTARTESRMLYGTYTITDKGLHMAFNLSAGMTPG